MKLGSDDADRIKRELRELWDFLASREKPTPLEGSAVSDCLCEMAEVSAGSRVLDVAAGGGEPAFTAARIVGPSGSVVLTDQSPGMLALARDRAKALRLTNLEFVVTDAATLDVRERDFDAALCRWGLMFVPEPELKPSLARIRGLLRPHRRFASAIWAEPAEVPTLGIEETAARRLIGRTPYEIGPFRFADVVSLEDALRAAGFTDIDSRRVNVATQFKSVEAFVAWRENTWLRKLASGVPEALREELTAAIRSGARCYARADGTVAMDNACVCVVARA